MGETCVKKLPILYGIGDGLVGKGILSLLCTSCGLKQRGLWRPGFFQPPYFWDSAPSVWKKRNRCDVRSRVRYSPSFEW